MQTSHTLGSSDFFVQINHAEVTASVNVDDLTVGISGNLGGASGSLGINHGQIGLEAAVDITVNGSLGRLSFSDLGNFGSLLKLEPHATLSMTLPIMGTLSADGFEMGGTFTLTLKPFDVFSGNDPDFDVSLSGFINAGGFFYLAGEFSFDKQAETIKVTDGANSSDVSATVLVIGAENEPSPIPSSTSTSPISVSDQS